MRTSVALPFVAVLWLACPIVASPLTFTMDFTNAMFDLGSSSEIDIDMQYTPSIFRFYCTNVYRYIDDRDPWPARPGDNFGIANGTAAQNYDPERIGIVNFFIPMSFIAFDWWTIGSSTLYVTAYDWVDNVVGTFSGSGSGLGATITAHSRSTFIQYFTFHDSGGFVRISNLTYDLVPEPPAIALLATGLAVIGIIAYRRGRI